MYGQAHLYKFIIKAGPSLATGTSTDVVPAILSELRTVGEGHLTLASQVRVGLWGGVGARGS